MATSGAKKPAKLTREDKKALRAGKREKRRENVRNIKQAFVLTKEADPRFVPVLVMATAVTVAALYLIVFFVTGSAYLPIPFAVLGGLVVAMFVFSRRAQ